MEWIPKEKNGSKNRPGWPEASGPMTEAGSMASDQALYSSLLLPQEALARLPAKVSERVTGQVSCLSAKGLFCSASRERRSYLVWGGQRWGPLIWAWAAYDISSREMLTAAVGIQSHVDKSCISRHQSRQEFTWAVSDTTLLSQWTLLMHDIWVDVSGENTHTDSAHDQWRKQQWLF